MGFLKNAAAVFVLKSGIRRLIALFSVVVVLAGAGRVDAAGGLLVTADALEMDQKLQVAVFSGNVVAEDGDMRLTSDKMTVHYVMKSQAGGRGSVREVNADGNVAIKQGESHGTADLAVYNVVRRTLELVGGEKNASVQRGGDHLEGKRILLTLGTDLRIDKVSVQGGGKKRVSARISPSGRVEGEGRTATLPDLVVGDGLRGGSSRKTDAPKRPAVKGSTPPQQETKTNQERKSPPGVDPVDRSGQDRGDRSGQDRGDRSGQDRGD